MKLSAFVACATLAFTSLAHAALEEPIKTESGLVSGTKAWGHGVRMYRGIPFAAPPVGDNRWREPQPVKPWTNVLAAEKFGPACAQQQRPLYVSIGNTGVNGFSEDCLYLNVWTPAKAAGEKLPVMVWVYGGGGREGSGGEPFYDPSNLAKRGVVVVTFNYRLNVFGWMAHPELSAENPRRVSGNYGALDQLAALKWIKANIAGFGGDAANVTVFGEAFGSQSVNRLMASPLGQGLFHRAIAVSRTAFFPLDTLKQAEAQGQAFGARLGAPSIAALRALPAQTVLQAYLNDPSPSRSAPVVDGYFLPSDVRAMFETGRQVDVPLLTGGADDEGGGPQRREGPPKTIAEYRAFLDQGYGGKADALFSAYPARRDQDAADAYNALQRDANFAGHRLWAQLQTATGKQPAYLYLFTFSTPEWGADGEARRIGSPHAGDLAYGFDNLRYADNAYSGEDEKMADITADYWVNFARNGDPNGKGLPTWPAYNAKAERMINLKLPPVAQPLINPRGLDLLTPQ